MLFALVMAASVTVAVGYVALAALRQPFAGPAAVTSQPPAVASATPSASGQPTAPTAPTASNDPQVASRVLFQNIERESGYARVAQVPADNPTGPRTVSDMTCERIHFAAGQGLCLVPEHGLVTTYRAVVFDSAFQAVHEVALGGAPTRARVSPDGRYGAATVFVFGHSYADANFSTQTLIIDMETGASLGDLEAFTTLRDGVAWQSEDFNFWGVTFSPSDSSTFYATVRSAARTYLVRGDIEERSMEVLGENVECPSLSPDGTTVAFKKLAEGLIGQWRLHVLDLETMTDLPLAETRNIDDQVEWLDERTVLYGDGQHIWSVPSDGSGEPTMFISDGLSPAVVR